MSPRAAPCRGPRGAALVAVLWTVAALTVLVGGVVQAQRGELRMAQATRSQAAAAALGLAATHRVAQRMVGGALAVQRLIAVDQPVGPQTIAVEVMPLTGLIDLNAAPQELLALLFADAGVADAAALARRLVDRRGGTAEAPPQPLETEDELLQLQGLDHDVHARIAGFVTVGAGGAGRVNPLAAPVGVLRLLARGNDAVAARIAADRDSGLAAIDTTRLESAFMDTAVGSRFRCTARVTLGDGSTYAVSSDLDLTPGLGAPWRVLRTRVHRITD